MKREKQEKHKVPQPLRSLSVGCQLPPPYPQTGFTCFLVINTSNIIIIITINVITVIILVVILITMITVTANMMISPVYFFSISSEYHYHYLHHSHLHCYHHDKHFDHHHLYLKLILKLESSCFLVRLKMPACLSATSSS